MADEEAKAESKVKAAVSSLGEGCSTLIAVYVGAVIVAVIITQLQRQDMPSVSTADPVEYGTPSQIGAVDLDTTDEYATAAPGPYPSDSSVEIYTPDLEAELDSSLYEPTPSLEPLSPTNPNPDLNQSLLTQAGVLTTQDAASPVNVRQEPALSAPIQAVGYAGNAVQILDQSTDAEGFTWYYVQLTDSGRAGWIRGDYVQILAPDVEADESPDDVVPSSDQLSPFSAL